MVIKNLEIYKKDMHPELRIGNRRFGSVKGAGPL